MKARSARFRACVLVAFVLASCSGTAPTTSQLPETVSTTNANRDLDPLPRPLDGEDQADFFVRCFAHFGVVAYNVRKEFPDAYVGGGVRIVIPEGTNPAQQAQMQRCIEVAVEAGISFDRDDPEQVKAKYEGLLELLDCLTEKGFAVPDPPSQDLFLEAKGDFDPYIAMGLFSIKEASRACPSDWFSIGDYSDVDLSKLGNGDQ